MQSPAEMSEAQRSEALERRVKMWTALGPPIRPTARDLACFERALMQAAPAPGAEVMLLGSTPELRSLILGHGHRLTCCDFDELFFEAMSTLLTARGEERFIHSDWLALPERRHYDVIVGDASLNMLSWSALCEMLAKLPKLLRPGGRALLGIQARNPQHDQGTLARAIREYEGERTHFPFIMAIHTLVESLRNAEHPEMSRREYYERTVSRYLSDAEMDSLRPLLNDKRNCYPDEAELLASIETHLELLGRTVFVERDPWALWHLYVLASRAG